MLSEGLSEPLRKTHWLSADRPPESTWLALPEAKGTISADRTHAPDRTEVRRLRDQLSCALLFGR